MNITLNKSLSIIVIGCALIFSSLVSGQTEISPTQYSKFKIGLELGSGYGFKLRTNNQIDGNYSNSGMNYTLRLKWGSGNVFGAGIETGWISISSLDSENLLTKLGPTNVSASLNAIPVVFMVTTQYANFQLHTGLGYYNVRSSSTVFNSTILSNEWDFGYLVSMGYAQPINSTFKIGAEVKWINISEVQISTLAFQLKLLVKLLEY